MGLQEDWEAELPEAVKRDSLWKMEAYRLGLFVAYIGWRDVTKLVEDRRTRSVADQLYRALGSISANLAEGYSRGTPRDRAHFYEYALGSVRESRDWYIKATPILGPLVINHRVDLLTQVARLLLVTVPNQRGQVLKEEPAIYTPHPNISDPVETSEYLTIDTDPSRLPTLNSLLEHIPEP
jgi:four helix bundle protein